MGKIVDWFGSWRLLSWRTALVVGFVLYTLIGFFVVPWVAEKVIVSVADKRLGREVTVEKIRCNPFTLSLTVEGFSLPDRPGSTLMSFDKMYANLQASSLFRWALTLKELQVERPYAAVRRFEDKGINVLELFDAFQSTAKPTDEKKGLPRAVLQEILVTDGRLEVEDRARDEPMLWQWGPVELVLHDISTLPDEEGDKEFSIGLPDGGMMSLAGTLVVEPFELDGSLSIDKILIANLWRAVGEKFEFELSGGALATELHYRATLQDDGLHVEVSEAEFRVTDFGLELRDTDTELLKAESVVVSGVNAKWPEQQVEADSLVVESAFAQVWIEPDGTPSWEILVPEPTREEVVKAYEYIDERVDFDAVLGRFEVRNASAAFEDRTFSEPARLEVSDAGVVLTDVASQPGSEWGLEASAAIAGESRASAKGTLVAVPLTLDVEVELEGLELAQFQAYVAKVAPLDLRAGVLTTSGRARVSPSEEAPDITFNGELAVTGLDLDETVTGGTLLGWGDLKVGGIQAAVAPTSLDVETVDIYTAGLEIAVAEDGTINLLEFFKALGEGEGATNGDADDKEDGLPPVHIARLELHDCYGRYTDATTVEPFETKIKAVNGTISKIATDTKTGAELEIDAAVDSGGLVRINGAIDPFDYQRFTDLDVDVSDAVLPPMSLISIKMIGFPIETGRMSLDLSYDIVGQQLASTNHVEIDNLHLGDRVEGEGTIKLPVKLGVSLLKDKNGRITLDIPIEGDLSNPDFVMVSAIQSAATDMVSEIAKSPFRLLGRLAGGSEDQNLELVEFAAGSAVLEEHVAANLSTLAKALEQRPALELEIEGTIDEEADASSLREMAFVAEVGEGEQADIPTAKLEKMYAAKSSGAELEAFREQHTSSTVDGALDEVAYREALRTGVVEAQPIDDSLVQALAPARADAIRAFLVDQAGVDPSRVKVLTETATIDTGEQRVSCRLAVAPGN